MGVRKANPEAVESIMEKMAMDSTYTYQSVGSSWKDSRTYTCPVDGYYILGCRGIGDGASTPAWDIGTTYGNMFFGNQSQATLWIPIYFKKGTTLVTRDMSGASTNLYSVLGYWYKA